MLVSYLQYSFLIVSYFLTLVKLYIYDDSELIHCNALVTVLVSSKYADIYEHTCSV